MTRISFWRTPRWAAPTRVTNLLTVDMEMEPVPGYRFASWEKGYGDFRLVPDFATPRVASWLEKTALLICDVQDFSWVRTVLLPVLP